MEDIALPSWKIILPIVAGFFILGLLVYGSSLNDKFVAWDDTSLIYSQPVIKGISWENTRHAFSMYDPELYIPLTFLSYQIDYAIGGLNPMVYHTTNLLLHIISALLVAWLAVLVTKRRWIGLLCGLLFLLHPLNTEAVAWASARKDALPTPLFLASIITYFYYRQSQSSGRAIILYGVSLFCLALALFGKVVVLTLPIILLLIDFLEHRKWNLGAVMEKLPYFAFSVAFGIAAMFGKKEVVAGSTAWQKFLMAFKSTVFYLEKIFIPTNLSVIYPYHAAISIASSDFTIPIIIVVALTACALYSLKWTRVITFCWLFFLLNLAPSFVNIAKGGDIYFASDRYAYIASIGIFLLVGWSLAWLIERRPWSDWMTRSIVMAASTVVLLIFAMMANAQAAVWADTVSLLTHATALYPDSYPAHINLAIALREQGDSEEAMNHLKAAQDIHDSVDVHDNYAAIYKRQGNTQQAEDEYRKAMTIDAKNAEPVFGLGILYEEQRQHDKAIRMYQQAIAIEPTFTAVYNNLGGIYVEQKEFADAEALYRKAISIVPTFPDGHYNLGIVLEQEGKFADAAAEYGQALKLNPDSTDTLLSLAGAQLRLGQNTNALSSLRRLFKLDPQNADAKALLKEMARMGIIGTK